MGRRDIKETDKALERARKVVEETITIGTEASPHHPLQGPFPLVLPSSKRHPLMRMTVMMRRRRRKGGW